MDRLLCDVDDRLGTNGVQELKVTQCTTCVVCVCEHRKDGMLTQCISLACGCHPASGLLGSLP